INPMIVEGQIQGGIAQGLAQALYEEAFYDSSGNLLTSSLNDYLVPTAVEMPDVVSDSTVTPSPHNPLGVKGIGEAGTIASTPAVVNAVLDALAHLGVRHIDMPLTPEKVFRAIKSAAR
ncbi:MAG: molybdopterin-dependent oxidoreductase, partial [Aigarchaeota archaeon]|nr:molybdopterin-dependent oxidoreductase [Aigarchaeota archaeon]